MASCLEAWQSGKTLGSVDRHALWDGRRTAEMVISESESVKRKASDGCEGFESPPFHERLKYKKHE